MANADIIFKPEQRVEFNTPPHTGNGKISGMASAINAYPVLGTIWIVELDEPIPDYDYRCIAVASAYLTPIN